jgi:glyoxylase-like metal-dependent hydrolase (beta-lactamase superfamily II)
MNIEQFWVFHCGYSKIPRWMIVEGGGRQEIKLPFLAALAVHPEHGPILIDAPFGTEGPSNVGEFLGGVLRKIGVVFKDEWAVIPRIERLGFRASEVNHVLMTHMHFDHTGGMKSLGHASFHINRDEWVAATSMSAFAARTKGYVVEDYRALTSRVEKLDLSGATIEKGVDVFGDGSIEAVPLPGHSAGHTGWRIRLADREIFYVGDAAFSVGHITQNQELGIFPKIAADSKKIAGQTLEKLRWWHRDHPDVEILTSHDVDLGQACMNGPLGVHVSAG